MGIERGLEYECFNSKWGGNSKIKVDGIPPKKKMELSSVGSSGCLNFIKIAFYNYSLTEIWSTVKVDRNIYIIGTLGAGSNGEITILKYNLESGFDSNYTKFTGKTQGRDGTVSAIAYGKEEILITTYGYLFKFNVNDKKITTVITNNDSLIGRRNKLFSFKNEIYISTDVTQFGELENVVFKINVEERKMTKITTLGSSSDGKIVNAFEYENKLMLILGDGQYAYLNLDNNTVTIQGNLPESGYCLKINGKLHAFREDTIKSKRTTHYVFGNGAWTQKDNLNYNVGLNNRGNDSDVGLICPNRPTENEAVSGNKENFMIVTDRLFLEKRRE